MPKRNLIQHAYFHAAATLLCQKSVKCVAKRGEHANLIACRDIFRHAKFADALV